ncbi:MAG: DUF2330 domain-containing protein [Myxococcales bacterium]|nr:DUF2330 domain-containing protein [Myxococcales bacterium]
MVTALVGAWLAPEALACGGLFCNSVQPVVQNAERIVFDIDRQTGVTDVHVQIFYEGPADEFAWIVPVPANPELFISSQAMFDALAVQTGPIFQRNVVEEGRCREVNVGFGAAEMGIAMADSAPSSPGGYSGVDVVSQGQVGAFDTVVLKADSDEALLTFLQESGYDLPDALGPVLSPYIGFEAHFVALKLSKDQDTGDISPLGMRYPSDRAMIPIQLTSVAAADDMPLEVYVFSDRRAVPQSYLHVQINEAAIDWWTGGQNYSSVITQAADEAGGHAFATDYFGSPEPFLQLYDFDVRQLRAASTPTDWVRAVQRQGLPFNTQLINAVADIVGAPAGADPAQVFWGPEEFTLMDPELFDADEATDELEERVLLGLMEAEDLFERPLMTRMTSSLSAVEMTKDPIFVLNADLSTAEHEVPQVRSADEVFECGANRRRGDARRRLVLSDGREILLPSTSWFAANEITEIEYIQDLGDTKAQIIEQLDGTGAGEILTDHTADFAALTDAHNAAVRQLLGCGCTSTGGGAGAILGVGLVALLAARRRRR